MFLEVNTLLSIMYSARVFTTIILLIHPIAQMDTSPA